MKDTVEAGNWVCLICALGGTEAREMHQGPWELSWTEFCQFLNISPWQGST